MRLALTIEYEGTRYHGFQFQANAPSIQAEVERALGQFTGENIRIKGAGRTDAGVHALGQVVAFDTASQLRVEDFVSALNFHLPDDIAVKAAQEVSQSFDPRRSAKSRRYRYAILNSATPSPMERRFTRLVRKPLDEVAMEQGAESLIGKRDFAPFSGPLNHKNATTIREVYSSRVTRVGNKVIFDIQANSFLPQQVRRTIGALVQLGLGRISLSQFLETARSKSRGAASYVMPPQGLCLVEVRYQDPCARTGETNDHRR